MGKGIIVCGLNGAGKSTLGRALAERAGYHWIDIEDLYFPKTDSDYRYASARTQKEVETLLLQEMKAHENVVLTAVKGDYGEDISSFFECAVLLEVPRELRLQRVKNRSFQKFGDRMLAGGDLYEREERFFAFAALRDENTVTEWLRSVKCPVIRLDGTKAVEENVNFLMDCLENGVCGGRHVRTGI